MECPICGAPLRYLRERTDLIVEVWWCPEFHCAEEVFVYKKEVQLGE